MKKILFGLFLLNLGAVAQSSSPLTLTDCLNIAFMNHPAIQSGEWHLKSLEAIYQREKSAYYPKLFLDGQHLQLFYPKYNYRQQSWLLSGDWSAGHWLKKSAQSAAAMTDAGKAGLSAARLHLARRISAIYFELLQSDIQQQSLDARKMLLEQHASIAEARWKAGVRTRVDLLQTRAALLQLEQERQSVLTRGTQLRRELATLLYGSPERLAGIQSFPLENTAAPRELNLSAILDTLREQHPDMQALDFQIRATQLERLRITAELLPHLQAWGGYIADGDPTAEGNYALAGVGVSIPLFLWGQSRHQKEHITAQVHDLEYQRSHLENELKIEVEKILSEISRLRETIQLQRAQLGLTREAYELAKSHYQTGLMTNLEYLAAQRDWQENRLRLQETQLNVLKRQVDLYLLTGNYQKIAQLQGG